MKTEMQVTWVISATSAEMRLIIGALRGTLKAEDFERAMELADSITQDRGIATHQLAREMEKHVANMQKERDE